MNRNSNLQKLVSDGQGGFFGDAWNGIKGAAKKVDNALTAPVRSMINFGKQAVGEITNPTFFDNMSAKYLGSGKGEKLRSIVNDKTFFSPIVKNNEIADLNFRQINNEEAPYGGYFTPKQADQGGEYKNTLLRKLVGSEPGKNIVNNTGPGAETKTLAHEVLHKVWDSQVQNKGAGKAFESKFLKVVGEDPRAMAYLEDRGLMGNPMYGGGTKLSEVPATEVFSYLGELWAEAPWTMPKHLQPFYKNVFDFNVSPERRDQADKSHIREDLTNAKDRVRMMEEFPILNPGLSDLHKSWLAEDLKTAESDLNSLSQLNSEYVMGSPYNRGTIGPDRRTFLQKTLQNVSRPVQNVADSVTGYFKNFF